MYIYIYIYICMYTCIQHNICLFDAISNKHTNITHTKLFNTRSTKVFNSKHRPALYLHSALERFQNPDLRFFWNFSSTSVVEATHVRAYDDRATGSVVRNSYGSTLCPVVILGLTCALLRITVIALQTCLV